MFYINSVCISGLCKYDFSFAALKPLEDTIVARATAPGSAAIAIVRVTGPQSFDLAEKVSNKPVHSFKSHTLHFSAFIDSAGVIDEGVMLVYRSPKSYTGQDTVEFNVHGSEYIVERLIQALCTFGGRPADPGEFTLRAFINGKLDLAQAEGVADMIASDSAASHQAALKQLKGGVSNEIGDLRERLIHFASLIELELDFGEEDVEFADRNLLQNLLDEVKSILLGLMGTFKYGNAVKSGIQVVLAGRPNAGKSTLFNNLLGEDRAIVSSTAGTTRDSIEDFLNVEGLKLRLTDTAGIREAEDEIEKLGIERTYKELAGGAIALFVFDVSGEEPEQVAADLEDIKKFTDHIIAIGNKVDAARMGINGIQEKFTLKLGGHAKDLIFVSAKNASDTQLIKETIMKLVSTFQVSADHSLITSVRHFNALNKSLEAVDKSISAVQQGISGELLSFEIRQALHALGEITGQITTDDLLDNIFSKFCIGK